MTNIERSFIMRRYPWLFIGLSIAFFVLTAIAHAVFTRVARHQSIFPIGLFLLYVVGGMLMVGITVVIIRNLLAAQRLAAIKEQERLRHQILQMAAHELRNPMASIKAMLALLRRRMDGASAPEATLALAATIENEVDRLANILNELLEAFQAETDRIHLRKVPLDLPRCVQMALQPFLASESQREFHVDVDPRANPLLVIGDALRIDEVIRNLLNNAVKYSPCDQPIVIRIYPEGNEAVVAISDFGIGIPEEYHERIFESFFRGDNFGDRDPGGMGLGLYICREIIRRHNGSITLESKPGKGSTFYVRLPRYAASPVDGASSFDTEDPLEYVSAS